MQIGSDQWHEVIASGAAAMNIAITPHQTMQMARHAQLLLSWNRRINLTAITDPREMAIKHYLDSLAALTYLPSGAICLDLGAGGGFPGIPLKIMRPQQQIVLIDSIRKKVSFIKEAIRKLQLANAEALHIRAEELGRLDAHRRGYGVIVCRAVSDLSTIVSLCDPLLASGGRIIALKGPAEIDTPLKNYPGLTIKHFEYRLPVSGDPRSLVVVTRS